jgi:hypothetical protein
VSCSLPRQDLPLFICSRGVISTFVSSVFVFKRRLIVTPANSLVGRKTDVDFDLSRWTCNPHILTCSIHYSVLLILRTELQELTCMLSQRKAIDLDSEPEAEADSGAEEGWTPYGTKTGKTTSDEEPDDRQEPSDASDEEQKNTGETFRLGEQDEKFQDFRKSLEIKDDAVNR